MPTYLAVVTPEPQGFRATFPDFPSLETRAATLDAVRIEAQGLVEEHLATAFGETAGAAPRTLDEVAALAPGRVLLALGVQAPRSKAVRINITIPEDLLQAVDRSASAHSMSRSRFLAKAVEAVVTGTGHGGVRVRLSESTLAAADQAAGTHQMDRGAFLAGLIEVGLGLREGHGGK
jgi:predicted DNA binding CopG/RHH family protein/predicted RNase H-like HicB family nuclease